MGGKYVFRFLNVQNTLYFTHTLVYSFAGYMFFFFRIKLSFPHHFQGVAVFSSDQHYTAENCEAVLNPYLFLCNLLPLASVLKVLC